VMAASRFLLLEGPATVQDRWEEVAGYSPSTLAIGISALLCAADLIDDAGDHATATFIRDHADFVEANIERWTVTTDGTLVDGIKRHYIRCKPDTSDSADPNAGTLVLANQAPGGPYAYPAKDIVDAGFLELVRYGVRAAGDPLIEDSLRVVDAVLKVDTPGGPCWHRYNHDGYGQRADGTAYRNWGVGRLWPLLTGERGHYELAAGRSATTYVKAMENFAVGIGLIPEQIWDQEAIPEKLLYKGGPTGAAIPLLWAHAEYVKLVRSIADGRVFDCLPPVHARYVDRTQPRGAPVVSWRSKRPVQSLPEGQTLRIMAGEPFTLIWTSDDWRTKHDTPAKATAIGVWFVDISPTRGVTAPLEFTFQWTTENRWEGRNYTVALR
jgi:glucoamylase